MSISSFLDLNSRSRLSVVIQIDASAVLTMTRNAHSHSSSESFLQNAVGYCTYRLADTSTKYDRLVSEYVAQMAKNMTLQTKHHSFGSFCPDLDNRIPEKLQVFPWHKKCTLSRSHVAISLLRAQDRVCCVRLGAEVTDKKHSRVVSGKTRYVSTFPKVDNFFLKT